MKKNKVLGLLLSLVLMVGLVACGSDSKTIEVSGSTSVAPLMEKIKEAYAKKDATTINMSADGSSAGIKAASDGVSDIGMSSRELTSEEKAKLVEHVIAIDAIAVVVNKDNGVTNLSMEQLKDIYSGKIKNWKELGGSDLPIVLVSRENGSGTRTAFEELVKLLKEDKSSVVDDNKPVIVNSTGAVLENVKQNKGAIGYMSLGSVNSDIKALDINKVVANTSNVKNNTYVLKRNFILVTKKDNTKSTSLIDYILSSEGQEVVVKAGYISIK